MDDLSVMDEATAGVLLREDFPAVAHKNSIR
jgi:hypothetical protein